MKNTTRRAPAAVYAVLVICTVALMATQPRSDELRDSSEFDLLLSAGTERVEFEVELELSDAVLEAPLERPLTVNAEIRALLIPEGSPESGDVPSVRAMVQPLDGTTGNTGDGQARVDLSEDCFDGGRCQRRFSVEITRMGSAAHDVVAHVALSADGEYEERPDGAEVELRHTHDLNDPVPLGPYAADFGTDLVVGQDGGVVTLTRFADADEGTVSVAAPEYSPGSPTGDAISLQPLSVGAPSLSLPYGFVTELDPFDGCDSSQECVREYEMSRPRPEEHPPRMFVVETDRALLEVGRSSLPDLDVTATGTERGTASLRPGEQLRLARQLRLVRPPADDPDVWRPAPIVDIVAVELRASAVDLRDGAVEMSLGGPTFSPSSYRSGRRLLVPDRPTAGTVRFLSEDTRAFDVIADDTILVFLEPRDTKADVIWSLRVVIAGDSNLLPGDRLELVEPAQDE